MKIPALSRATTRIPRGAIRHLGGAGSLAQAILSKKKQPEAARYSRRNENPCAKCIKGRHTLCTSIHCPCEICNPIENNG